MDTVCNICAENFNKRRRNVTCKCEFTCCSDCIKKYILSKNEFASCMSCKIIWDRKFIAKNLEKTFINKSYKTHLESVYHEREVGMFQATQPHVEKEIAIENIRTEIGQIESDYKKKRYELCTNLYILVNNEAEKKTFIRKCPNSNCKGFLSSGLKCGICNCFSCADCREIKGFTTEEKLSHECNKDIVESIKFMKNDTKPCPFCASLTYKISGCSQIFCVECHSQWDWKTGKITTGAIHNPHYFEWQAKNNNGNVPRNPLEVLCGREIDHNFVRRFVGTDTKTGEVLRRISHNIIHIRLVDIPKFTRDVLLDNLPFRINYMRGKVSLEKFKTLTQRKEKEKEKYNEIFGILTMFVSCMTDLLYRVDDTNRVECIKEMNYLRMYCNEQLHDVSYTYNCKIYEITTQFKII
jgi:hypothetical protein